MFLGLLTSIVNAPNHTRCISLNNQRCMTQPTLINLQLNKYTQGLRYCPFAVNLDSCVESCNALKGLCNKVCVPNKVEDLNLSIFKIITTISGSKT